MNPKTLALLIPLWVFESLGGRGYDRCEPRVDDSIRCENPWEVSIYQYEIKPDKDPPFEMVYLKSTKWRQYEDKNSRDNNRPDPNFMQCEPHQPTEKERD